MLELIDEKALERAFTEIGKTQAKVNKATQTIVKNWTEEDEDMDDLITTIAVSSIQIRNKDMADKLIDDYNEGRKNGQKINKR